MLHSTFATWKALYLYGFLDDAKLTLSETRDGVGLYRHCFKTRIEARWAF
jgi:hypothetical protein